MASCEQAGLIAEPGLKKHYLEQLAKEGKAEWEDFDWSQLGDIAHSGLAYEIFGQYHAPKEEPAIPSELLASACSFSDTAVLILGRCSGGEECDRHLEGDYYLTQSENTLVEQVCGRFIYADGCVIIALNQQTLGTQGVALI